MILILDLEKRTPDIEKIAALALSDSTQFSQILRGLYSKNYPVRYKNFKAVCLISEEVFKRWDMESNAAAKPAVPIQEHTKIAQEEMRTQERR